MEIKVHIGATIKLQSSYDVGDLIKYRSRRNQEPPLYSKIINIIPKIRHDDKTDSFKMAAVFIMENRDHVWFYEVIGVEKKGNE